jgi:hypothetical protein
MLLSLDLNIDDILKIPDESLDILNIQGDERFDVKLEIQNEDDLFNEDDFKVIYKGVLTTVGGPSAIRPWTTVSITFFLYFNSKA